MGTLLICRWRSMGSYAEDSADDRGGRDGAPGLEAPVELEALTRRFPSSNRPFQSHNLTDPVTSRYHKRHRIN